MPRFLKVLLIWVLALPATGQVSLPYSTSFAAASQATVKQQWLGPWDQNLRCDGLDSLRFGPACCSQGQTVPWMGFAPFNYSCTHLSSDSGGAYLRLVNSYQIPGATQYVWAQPTVMSPEFSTTTMGLLSIRAAKNTLHMAHASTPWSSWSSHGNAEPYTALEVSLVPSSGGIAQVLDTFVLTNSWATYRVDARMLSNPTSGLFRIQLRLLGAGDAAIDWASLRSSPLLGIAVAGSCSALAPNGSIALSNFTAFTPPISAVWDHGATGTVLNYLSSGTYYVTLTDAAGTFARRRVVVPASVQLTQDSIRLIGNVSGQVFCTASGAGPITWQWTGPNGFNSTSVAPLLSTPGLYSVTATDSMNCSAQQVIPMRYSCGFIPAPPSWTDTICLGGTVALPNLTAPQASAVLRFWASPSDTSAATMLTFQTAFTSAVSGWVVRYSRWKDTLANCVSPAAVCSVWVAPAGPQLAVQSVLRCPSNAGFTFSWPNPGGNQIIEHRLPNSTAWSLGPPSLTGTQTNNPGSSYSFLVRTRDALNGCLSHEAAATYQVKSVTQASLAGPSGYGYGLLHSVTSSGLGSGTKFWTVSYGGQFEMADPNHPCHNQTSCATPDAQLTVRGTVVPCWNPPTVTVSVSQSPSAQVCDSVSTMMAQTTASYSCFGTQIDQAPPIVYFTPGGTLEVRVATQPSGYQVPGNPLAMSYASCAFTIPHQWQVRAFGTSTWQPWSSVFTGSPLSTFTDTNEVGFSVANADSLIQNHEVRLALERCQGVWSYSSAIELRSNLNTQERDPDSFIRVVPNPTKEYALIYWPQAILGKTWHVISMNGVVHAQGQATVEASLIRLNPGSYIVRILDSTITPARFIVLP